MAPRLLWGREIGCINIFYFSWLVWKLQIYKCWFQMVCFTFLSSEKLAIAMMLSLPTDSWATSLWVKSAGWTLNAWGMACVCLQMCACVYIPLSFFEIFLVLNQNMPKLELNSRLYAPEQLLFKKLILFLIRRPLLCNIVMVSAVHQHESSIGIYIYVSPLLSLPTASLHIPPF